MTDEYAVHLLSCVLKQKQPMRKGQTRFSADEVADLFVPQSKNTFSMFFFQNPKNVIFYVFLKCHFKKNVKNAERVIQVSFQSAAVFTLLHFEIAN